MKRIINKLSIALLAALVFTTGCKKEFLDTKPTDDVSGETIFQTTQVHTLLWTEHTVICGSH